MSVYMPLSAKAQVDTVTLNQLDGYLSKASGNVKIYLKDWVVYSVWTVHFGDSSFVANDYTSPGFPRQFSGSDSTESIFDKYPDLRIDLELEEIVAEQINWGRIEGKSLASIKFPDNMKYIGVYYRKDDVDHEMPQKRIMISHCPNLKEIILPKKLKFWSGVYDCKSLENVDVPEGTEMVSGFGDCNSLKTVNFPKSLKYSVGFNNCPSLVSVTLPDSIADSDGLDYVCFANCTSLESVTLPKNITGLGYYTFDEFYASDLEFSDLPFSNCKSLKSIEIPEGVEYIGVNAFWGCSSLTSIKLPSSLKKIANHAFANCTSLQEVILPEGLKEIGEFAFEGCTDLRKITIPAGVDTIGRGAFWACKALKNGGNPNRITVSGREMEYWDDDIVCDKFGNEIPISKFLSFSSLKSITIPDNVYYIDAEAFNGCASLSKVKIHDGITFKYNADKDYGHGSSFGYCINLKTVDLGKNIHNINGFGGFLYAETIVLRDEEFLDFEALWGEVKVYTIVDLDGDEVSKSVFLPGSVNPNCKIYVKKDLVQKYKDRMAEVNKNYDPKEKLNYKFLPLDEYKE